MVLNGDAVEDYIGGGQGWGFRIPHPRPLMHSQQSGQYCGRSVGQHHGKRRLLSCGMHGPVTVMRARLLLYSGRHATAIVEGCTLWLDDYISEKVCAVLLSSCFPHIVMEI
jgi:hypothetical protein